MASFLHLFSCCVKKEKGDDCSNMSAGAKAQKENPGLDQLESKDTSVEVHHSSDLGDLNVLTSTGPRAFNSSHQLLTEKHHQHQAAAVTKMNSKEGVDEDQEIKIPQVQLIQAGAAVHMTQPTPTASTNGLKAKDKIRDSAPPSARPSLNIPSHPQPFYDDNYADPGVGALPIVHRQRGGDEEFERLHQRFEDGRDQPRPNDPEDPVFGIILDVANDRPCIKDEKDKYEDSTAADGRQPIQLPNELLLLITKPLDDRDCVALALSGAFEGFADFHDAERKETAIAITYRHHFLSNPRFWSRFLSQHSCFPSSITVFNVNDCYWLPPELLSDAVIKLENLEQLNIRGTKVSVPHLAQVFKACKKITRLDFSFVEKSWEEILDVAGKESMDIITKSFKKLASLKIATSWMDARDYLDDPCLLIIRILSWCRDCVELTVVIMYMGDSFPRETFTLNSVEVEVQNMAKKDLFPKVKWILNLKKLVLIKHGAFSNMEDGSLEIRPLLFNDLCSFIFTGERAPSSLQCVWVERFILNTPLYSFWLNSPSKRSYYDTDTEQDIDLSEDYITYLQDCSTEHLGWVEEFPSLDQRGTNPSPYLSKLKHLRVDFVEEEEQRFKDFIHDHPNLEQLFIACDFVYVPSVGLTLTKLTTLSIDVIFINKEGMDTLVNFCPNVEVFHFCLRDPDEEEDIVPDISSERTLSAIRFKKLIVLKLFRTFQFHDGVFLLNIIKECPKLRRLHLDGNCEPDLFLRHFEQFLSLAVNLRDLRLGLDFNDNPIIPMLKSIQQFCPKLERLFLFENTFTPWNLYPLNLEDFFVQFATSMSCLICCCVEFDHINSSLEKGINQLVAEKVAPNRPSLWFRVCDIAPDEDPTLPLIHYLEIIEKECHLPSPEL